jgi:hypothetical protein
LKDFLAFLKSNWWIFSLGALFYFLFVQAYVYPNLSFDFSVTLKVSTWVKLLSSQVWFAAAFYFVFWIPNRRKLIEKKPRED